MSVPSNFEKPKAKAHSTVIRSNTVYTFSNFRIRMVGHKSV